MSWRWAKQKLICLWIDVFRLFSWSSGAWFMLDCQMTGHDFPHVLGSSLFTLLIFYIPLFSTLRTLYSVRLIFHLTNAGVFLGRADWSCSITIVFPWFFVYNVVRIGKNFQNEVSVERSAFADVSSYQLKSPGNFSGPKSKIQIEIYSPFCFVTDSLTMLSAKLLKPLSWMQTTIALWAPHVNSPRSICWNSNLTPRLLGQNGNFFTVPLSRNSWGRLKVIPLKWNLT